MSPPVCSGVLVTRSLVLCVCFVDRCLSFWPFYLFAIVLYIVLFRFTDIDYPFGIFKLFLTYEINCIIFNMLVIILNVQKDSLTYGIYLVNLFGCTCTSYESILILFLLPFRL